MGWLRLRYRIKKENLDKDRKILHNKNMDVKTKIDRIIKESPRKVCSCGCEFYDTKTVQLNVSPLLSETGKPEIILVGVLVCSKCGGESRGSLLVT